MNVAGYASVERLHQGANSVVHRATRVVDGLPVIVKVPSREPVSKADIQRLRHEYDVLRRLDFDGAVRPVEIVSGGNGVALVVEDRGGVSLQRLIATRLPTLRDALVLLRKIAERLQCVHKAGVIHRDIGPANIVVNEKTGDVQIIDFETASVFLSQSAGFEHPTRLAGTLAFMAPEQTGRMNRPVDYRSDFYALGATFHMLLTGQPPFVAQDPMELVHCHLARVPAPAHEIQSSVPKVVSAIASKLMAKMAEDRYQTLSSLMRDIDECIRQLDAHGTVQELTLGVGDDDGTIRPSQRLYGREVELERLSAAFSRVATGGARAVVLVGGDSGVGKTSLVRELYRPITKAHGFFISGKYEQFQRNQPASAIFGAFRSLVSQLMSEDEETMRRWAARFDEALDAKARLIIDVIPEFARIVGDRPELPELPSAEARARFEAAFRAFVRTIATEEHPLVLFLDDVQWADAASLALLQTMMQEDGISHLLVIAAYRDGEVSPIHPTMMAFDGLEKAGVPTERLTLGPLALAEVTSFVADTIRTPPDRVKDLASLIFGKTAGNPFFVIQFLNAAREAGHLRFDAARASWDWDLEALRGENVTDNVVGLVIGKLRLLPETVQRALSIAALLGSRFDRRTLSIALQVPDSDTNDALVTASQNGLIEPVSGVNDEVETVSFEDGGAKEFTFVHDRVQQAAYSLLERAERMAAHLAIGRLLLQRFSESALQRHAFDVVRHFDEARELLVDATERETFVTLNMLAAKQARSAQAHAAAAEHLERAALFLPPDVWTRAPGRAFEIALARADSESMLGRFEASERVLEEALRHDMNRRQRAALACIRIRNHQLNTRYADAQVVVREALAAFDIPFPEGAAGDMLGACIGRVQQKIGGRSLDFLEAVAVCSDPDALAILELCAVFLPSGFFLGGGLFELSGMLALEQVVDHGVHGAATAGLAVHAMITQAGGNLAEGAAIGRRMLHVVRRVGDLANESLACNMYGAHIGAWNEPVANLDAVLDRGYTAGVESGNVGMSAFAMNNKIINQNFRGVPIADLLESTPNYIRFANKIGNQMAADVLVAEHLALRALAGRTAGPLVFEGDGYESGEAFIAASESRKSFYATCAFLQERALCHLLQGDANAALADLERATPLLPYMPGNVMTAKHPFLMVLAMADSYAGGSAEQRAQWDGQIAEAHAKMKTWAAASSANFLPFLHLMEAEIARIQRRPWDALARYDEAVQTAHEFGFLYVEALANERCAQLWRSQGKEQFARVHLTQAKVAYDAWGAHPKAETLAEAGAGPYESGPMRRGLVPITAQDTLHATTSRAHLASLDILSVMKASHAIAGELVRDRLLAVLMRVILENAGAQRVVLFLPTEDGSLALAAEGSDRNPGHVPTTPEPLRDWERGLRSVVHFVERSGESVIVADATADARFSGDAYVAREKVRSLLCMPIRKQGLLVGVLYLENNVTVGAFTIERFEVLRILGAQLAVSLENARLYARLEAAMNEAKESERLKSEFLATTSHELRTPLNSIINIPSGLLAQFAPIRTARCSSCNARFKLADDEALDPTAACSDCGKAGLREEGGWAHAGDAGEMVALLKDIEQAGHHLLGVVEGILNWSRLEAGKATPVLSNVPIVDAFAGCESVTRPFAQQHRVEVRFASSEPTQVRADRVMLVQILTNLVSNAVKFSKDGGVVRVDYQTANGLCRIAVRDDGIGIAAEHHTAIFERFRQVESGSTRRRGGTGLGLAITKKLVELLGGTIAVDSAPGQGSTFTVSLPVSTSSSEMAEGTPDVASTPSRTPAAAGMR